MNDIGIPSETQNASFGLRNIAKTNTTKTKPKYAFFVNKSILPFKRTDSSLNVPISTPLGSVVAVLFT